MLSSLAIATDGPTDTSPTISAGTGSGSAAVEAKAALTWADAGEGAEFDAASHEGLRQALEGVARVGWNGTAGAAIVAALQHRAGAWAFLADRRCGRPRGSTDPSDVVAVAWLTLEKFASKTAEAQRPWAYLWTAVGNELVRMAIAESQLTDPARVRGTSPNPTAVVRVGLQSDILDRGPAGWQQAGADTAPDDVPPSAAVAELARRLAHDALDIPFWLDAIGRALDVMADARRSYEECTVRRDPYLRAVLDLRMEEISALAALLIGPRKGDRAAHSLLLALHHDLAIPTESVVGAQARIRLLQSRRHPAPRTSAA